MNDVQTIVINLDRSPQRLVAIGAQLDHLGLPWQRVAAVDGRALSDAQRACLDAASYRRKHGMEPSLGELGCYLSHHEAMGRLLESSALAGLILEDDAKLLDSLPSVLAQLMGNAHRWDMVKLSAVHSGTPVPVLSLVPGHALAVMLSRCTGSSAYLVNRRAAQIYRDALLPMSLPYDHVFDQGWRFGLKVRLVTPTPCVHDHQAGSTIATATPDGQAAPLPQSRKFKWPRRIPAFIYRLKNELARVRYGLAHSLREKLRQGGGQSAG